MENASRALLMAGGIFIALMIIGALLLMFNQIGDYEKAQSTGEKVSQVADFNKEFLKYTYDDIKGYELISLINKAIDFNGKSGIGNSVDYDKKITIKVKLGKSFANDHGVNGKLTLFETDEYEIKDSQNVFLKNINDFSELERKYTLGVMSKLSANYDSIKTYKDMKSENKSDVEIKNSGGKSIKEITGKDIEIDLKDIEKYREYSEFKSSTFKSNANPVYSGEQVVMLSFEYKSNK